MHQEEIYGMERQTVWNAKLVKIISSSPQRSRLSNRSFAVIGSIVQLAHCSRANHNMLIHPNPRPDPVSYSVIEFTELWSLTIFLNNRDAFEASDFEQAFFKISYM